jgi:hypothetical protein
VAEGDALLSAGLGVAPRFCWRLSSLFAWRSSFRISRRSFFERSFGGTDELGLAEADGVVVADNGVVVAEGDGEDSGGITRRRWSSPKFFCEAGDTLAAGDAASVGGAVGDVAGDDVDLAERGVNVGRGVGVVLPAGVAVTVAEGDVEGTGLAVRRTGVGRGVIVADDCGVAVAAGVAVVSGVARRNGVALAATVAVA